MTLVTLNTNFIVTPELLKESKKQLNKTRSSKKTTLGLEYDSAIQDDQSLCSKIIIKELFDSDNLFLELKNYLTQRVTRYLKKHSYYDSSRFLSKLESSAAKYLGQFSSKVKNDVNSKRIMIEYMLDIFRLAPYHEKLEDFITIRKKAYDFQKKLATSEFFPATVLIIKLFKETYDNKEKKNEQLIEKKFKYRILTLDYIFWLWENYSKEKLRVKHFERIYMLKQLVTHLLDLYPELKLMKENYRKTYPNIEQNVLKTIHNVDVGSVGQYVSKVFDIYQIEPELKQFTDLSEVPEEFSVDEAKYFKTMKCSTGYLNSIKNQIVEYDISREDSDNLKSSPDVSKNKLANKTPIDNNQVFFNIPQSNIEFDDEKYFESTLVQKRTNEKTELIEKLKKLYANTIDKVIEHEEEPVSLYTVLSQTKEYKIYQKNDSNCNLPLIKAKMTVRGLTPEETFIMQYDYEIRSQYESIFTELRTIEVVSPYQDYVTCDIKGPCWPIVDRDFLQKRTFAKDYKGNSYCLHLVSTDHPGLPKHPEKIRANTLISGYIINPHPENPDDTIITILAHTDIKGSIPKTLVNYSVKRAPKTWLNEFIAKGLIMKKKGKLVFKEDSIFHEKNWVNV